MNWNDPFKRRPRKRTPRPSTAVFAQPQDDASAVRERLPFRTCYSIRERLDNGYLC